jgi:thioredoxin reductase (NADPH)
MANKQRLRIAIVGGGPAGIATAIQLKRFDLEPVIFEKERLGGQLWNAHRVENYPGFFGQLSGAQLVNRFREHLDSYKIEVRKEAVLEVVYHIGNNAEDHYFTLNTSDGTHNGTYFADIVVEATGTRPKTSGLLELIPGELRWNVVFEAVPLLQVREKDILIVGAGDIAFDNALHLAEKGNRITMFYRGEHIKALPLLFRKVERSTRIRLIGSTVIQSVEKGKTKPLAVKFINSTMPTRAESLEFHHLLGAIGREPQELTVADSSSLPKEQLLSSGCYYRAGDVKNGLYRQVSIATGNGIETAMKIHSNIKSNKGNHEAR